METTAISQYLYLLDEAFQGTAGHSLLGNLRSLAPDDWTWVPQGGQRSICDIIQHIGGTKFMYHNHAFGDATLRWDSPLVNGDGVLSTLSSALPWLQEGQNLLRQSVALLDDADLLRPRMTNWGETNETRWIITAMIEHDLYHAGEINHIHSLHPQKDQGAFSS